MGDHDPKLMELPVALFMQGDKQACPGCVYEMGLLDMPRANPVTVSTPAFEARLVPEGLVVAFEDGFDPTMVQVVHNLAWRRTSRSGDALGVEDTYKLWAAAALKELVDMGMLRRNAEDPRVWETVEDGQVTSHGTLVFTE